MTLLVGCTACVLAVFLSLFSAQIAEVTTAKVRAQLAADAAALAAVAESGPSGGGEPKLLAERFAELNEGEMIECLCERGDSAMQVVVSVDGVIAKSRAVIDVDALAPADIGFGTLGLHPTLRAAAEELVEASGGAVTIVSGYRSSREQAILWADALRRYGSREAADDWVAPPGHSMHERGLAIDLGGDLNLAGRLVDELDLPLHRPLPHEPGHFELLGTR